MSDCVQCEAHKLLRGCIPIHLLYPFLRSLVPLSGLIEEGSTGRGLWAQLGTHPGRVLAVLLLIGVATVVPVAR